MTLENMQQDGTALSAADAISQIPIAEQYADRSEAAPERVDRAREPDGKFAKPVEKPAVEAKQAAEPAATEDDEDYLEYEVAPEKDGDEPRRERHKLSEVLEGFREAKTLKQQLEEARTSQPLPEDYEQRLLETVQERSKYTNAVMEWMRQSVPRQPNRELLNPQSENFNPELYYQQLQQHDNAVAQRAAAKQEIERVEALNAQEMQAIHESRLARESAALSKIWPELKDKATQSKVVADLKQHYGQYGLDDKMIGSITHHVFYAIAKDALENRASKAAKQEAVKVVRDKPKIVRAAARSNSNSAAATFQSAFGRASQSGSLEDAAAAIASLNR